MMTPTMRVFAGALAMSTICGSTAGAQQDTSAVATMVEGLTIDAQTGRPFPNVQIRFDSGQRVTTDEHGRYAIAGVRPGSHHLAIVTGRCKVTFAAIELAPGETKHMAFSVPSERVGQKPTVAEMKKHSEGKYYGGEELMDMNVRNLLDAVQRVAPDMVGPQGVQPGTGGQLMGRTRTAQGTTTPVVVFDGMVINDGVRALRDLKPGDVASLEILKGASRGWEYGSGGAGGVIKVVTHHGDVGYTVFQPDLCDIGDWAGGIDDGPH